jgi:hypothetical protein
VCEGREMAGKKPGDEQGGGDGPERADAVPAADASGPKLGRLEELPQEDLSRFELDVRREARGSEGGDPVAVIVKVAEAGYVPPGVQVRSQIAPQMFTAEVRRVDLERLQQDPRVVSVGTAKPLRPQEG